MIIVFVTCYLLLVTCYRTPAPPPINLRHHKVPQSRPPLKISFTNPNNAVRNDSESHFVQNTLILYRKPLLETACLTVMLFSNHVRVSGTKCHPKALWYTSPPFCVSNRIDCCALPDAELLPSDNPVRIFSLLQTTDTSHCRTHLCSPTCRARPHFQMRCRIHEYALHAPLPPYPVPVVCKII